MSVSFRDRMYEDRRNLVARIEIVRAYVKALEDIEKLMRVRANASVDVYDAMAVVSAELCPRAPVIVLTSPPRMPLLAAR